MIELVGDPSHPFADCGCRRGSRQRMQNKIKKQPFATAEAAAMLPPCFCRAIRLTFLSLVDAVSLCFCFMLAFSRLSSLFSRLSSLFSRCCSFLRSLFALATSNFASGHRLRPQLPRPFAAPSLARRNARSDEIRPPSPARYGAVWCEAIPLTKTYPLSRSDNPLPPAPRAFRRARINSTFRRLLRSAAFC